MRILCCRGENKRKWRNLSDGNGEGSMVKYSETDVETIIKNNIIIGFLSEIFWRGEEKVEKSNILMYTTEDGVTKVEVTFDNDTVWLSLDQIADLFQRNKSTISRHIKNIF